MRCELIEHEGCFDIEMTAETMDEATRLARFGMASTKELRSKGVIARKDGTMIGYIVFGLRKNYYGNVGVK